MSEPRRWTLFGDEVRPLLPQGGYGPHEPITVVMGEDLAVKERVPVREDKATVADIEAIIDGLHELGLFDPCELDQEEVAFHLLARVFCSVEGAEDA